MDAEVSTHTFLTMIIEESVCFMSCEPFFFCNYSYVVNTEYIFISIFLHQTFFSSTEQCAWAIISPKEFKSWVTRISFALLSIFNVMQLILVKIKWHIKWKYLIQKFHDICLLYYFNLYLSIHSLRGSVVYNWFDAQCN